MVSPEIAPSFDEQSVFLSIVFFFLFIGIRNLWLNLVRNLVIWSRDKRFLIANAIKNLIMGVSVGGVFYQTTNSVSIFGVLFQLNLFIMLGTFHFMIVLFVHMIRLSNIILVDA